MPVAQKPVFFKVETFNPLVLNQNIEADRLRFRRHCDWAIDNGYAIDVTPVSV